jgi:hypothetical protein
MYISFQELQLVYEQRVREYLARAEMREMVEPARQQRRATAVAGRNRS